MTDEQRLQAITEQLLIVRDNLFRGMSKSMQKLQARSINEVLELPNFTQSPQPEQEPVEDLQAKLKWATEQLEANINWEFVAAAKEEMLKAAWAEIKELREQIKEPEQERCVGCEACIDTACGRDECPKGWPKAAQPEQEPVEWGVDWGKDGNSVSIIKRLADGNIEVLAWEYAPHPPQRTEQEQQIETLKRCLFQMQEAAKDLVEQAKSLPPPQRTWVGLTDEDFAVCGDEDDVVLARYWERVCKEKNNA